jgi:uncharacterized protein with HEPN domain
MNQPLDKNKAYIQDILNSCEKCLAFTKGMNFENFELDEKTISATQHQILIIGEATKRLSAEYRSQHSHIPWKAMAGMRDILIHAYENADLEEIWKTIKVVIPELISKLKVLAEK